MLCFRCKQSFHPLHACHNKSLRVLIVGEDKDFAPDLDARLNAAILHTKPHGDDDNITLMTLSMFALAVIMGSRTMKLCANIGVWRSW